ncbi:MAG: PIN domain-containing protein [Burkholderiales bacterium]|nr:PIN domain-containing protein [Opitutaceae bacterium]
MTGTVYADTSLLVSLYLADANTPAALAAVTSAARPLLLTTWQEFEMENALRRRLFRRESTAADLAQADASLRADLAAGVVVAATLPLPAVLLLARQLTADHTALLGTRAFDVFQVAAALHLKAARFLSFDTRQLALARAAGLKTT